MKRILILTVLLLISSSAFAQVPSPSTPVPIPASVASLSVQATTSATKTIPALSNRSQVFFYLLGTETVWISVGTTTAVVGQGLPVTNNPVLPFLPLGPAIPMGRVSSTPSSLEVIQIGH